MRRFQITLKRVLIFIVLVAAAVAMLARALTSWGPINLVVLAWFMLLTAGVLACVPRVPHRPFSAGFAIFGLFYLMILASPQALPGMRPFVISPVHPWFRDLAEQHYGPDPGPPVDFIQWAETAKRQERLDSFITACHATTALGIGVVGGGLLLYLAKVRESRRWNREALPERPLEDFLLSPLMIDPPLNPK